MHRVLICLLLLEAALLAQGPPRRTPHASDCGKQIAWEQDLDAALKRAKKEKKPIFWFVPTAYRTALDRKQEVYWYMMGGAFSEPRVVEFVNANFVPLKLGFRSLVRGSKELALVPRKESKKLAEIYELAADQFAEPGFLILDRKGKQVATFDRQLTFQVDHFGRQLLTVLAPKKSKVGKLVFPQAPQDDLSDIRNKLARGAAAGAWKSLGLKRKALDESLVPESLWIEGLCLHAMRDHERADAAWRKLCEQHEDTSWAARAKLELEGWGPFRHGFATPIAPSETAAATKEQRSTRIAGVERDGRAQLQEALIWLLRAQRKDGSWQDSRYDFGGLDSLPNVHVAVTSIAARGLLEWRELEPQAIESALEKAAAYVIDEQHLALNDRDELIWAQVHRLEFLLRFVELEPKRRENLGPAIEKIIAAIESSQLKSGAYRHEYPNPFATASAILALKKAGELGFEVSDLKMKTASAALEGTRAKDGSYSYGMRGRGSEIASAGRRPLCELALLLTRRSNQRKLLRAVQVSWEHHEHFERARTNDDHTRPHGIGGFFYYYDLLGRVEATVRLESAKKKGLAKRARELVESLQEIDGSFIDSHELGKSYGSGMALTILSLCRPENQR